jgi:hypothetical protein
MQDLQWSRTQKMSTIYHAKYFAHDLTRRAAVGIDRLSMSLFDAAVDLNPHQIEAALFALQSPLSKGVILRRATAAALSGFTTFTFSGIAPLDLGRITQPGFDHRVSLILIEIDTEFRPQREISKGPACTARQICKFEGSAVSRNLREIFGRPVGAHATAEP